MSVQEEASKLSPVFPVCLSFFICEMGTRKPPLLLGCWKMKEITHVDLWEEFLEGSRWKVKRLRSDFGAPWTVAHKAPLSMEFSRQKILEWVVILFSRGSSQAGDQTWVSWIAGRFFTIWATREVSKRVINTGAAVVNNDAKGKSAVAEGKGSVQTTAVCGRSWPMTGGSSSQPTFLSTEQHVLASCWVPGLTYGTDMCQLPGITGVIRDTEHSPLLGTAYTKMSDLVQGCSDLCWARRALSIDGLAWVGVGDLSRTLTHDFVHHITAEKVDRWNSALLCKPSSIPMPRGGSLYWFMHRYPVGGLPCWLSSKEFDRQCRRCRFDPWVGKIPCRRAWQPTPVFLPGNPLQYSWNPMDRGVWQAVHGAAKSQTWLSD